MDLALLKFDVSGDRTVGPHWLWIVMTDSPASLAPVRSTGHLPMLESGCIIFGRIG